MKNQSMIEQIKQNESLNEQLIDLIFRIQSDETVLPIEHEDAKRILKAIAEIQDLLSGETEYLIEREEESGK